MQSPLRMDFIKVSKSLLIFLHYWICVNGRPDTEEVLLEELFNGFHGYNKNARPALSHEHSVQVQHGLTLRRIVKLEDGVLTADAWQKIIWIDSRLSWDGDGFDSDLDKINIPDNMIWIPDIILYDNAALCSERNCPGIRTVVRRNGTITWMPATRVTSYCSPVAREEINDVIHKGDLRCILKFGSWTYDLHRLNIEAMGDRPHMNDFLPHPDLEIVSTSAERQEFHYDCCSEAYPVIVYTLILRHKAKADGASNMMGDEGVVDDLTSESSDTINDDEKETDDDSAAPPVVGTEEDQGDVDQSSDSRGNASSVLGQNVSSVLSSNNTESVETDNSQDTSESDHDEDTSVESESHEKDEGHQSDVQTLNKPVVSETFTSN